MENEVLISMRIYSNTLTLKHQRTTVFTRMQVEGFSLKHLNMWSRLKIAYEVLNWTAPNHIGQNQIMRNQTETASPNHHVRSVIFWDTTQHRVVSPELDCTKPHRSEPDHAEPNRNCIAKSSCEICDLLRYYAA